ncbi:nitrogen fixation protein FixH [Hydrogenophaga laconesensis]|uniref:Nitrogen fixation protein FixH n=1 Tax=Hydrogenophaga laconesensis TaxID=1805971 RepID=A0ABU1VI02_9BURK|nr:nitrogen fixation protein FixH [Hydrogenophaga laconesensis]MDR7097057.1 hypothetical protein [Hydrogenophaga laconesensis]
MNPSTSPAVAAAPVAWWRVPHMWLVVGGPLAVVVASIFTAFIAVRNADPVLDKAEFERDRQAVQVLEGQAKTDALIKLQPAHQARNHAASPVVPREP